jgi:acyl homoserine lactone synthase
MATFFYGTPCSLGSELMRDLFRYRFQVFIEGLGWRLDKAHHGLEEDEFDRPDTVYIGAIDQQGEICGHARLLPTHRPYLLSEVFPRLMATPPNSSQVWEISRFSVSRPRRSATSEATQFELKNSRELLSNCLAWGQQRGVERFITVSPVGIGRLIKRMGVIAHKSGPIIDYDGHLIYALSIDVDENNLRSLGLEHLLMTESLDVVE